MPKISQKASKEPLDKPPHLCIGGGGKAEIERVKKTKIRVIGVGGGAGNIISEIASNLEKATFVAANTDLKSLKEIPRKVERFHFGGNLTQGLGTGMNPELGEMAAQNEKEKIKKILENQDLLILTACLGGGTASGATPIFAKISRSLGNLTLGIFTLPFKFEGEKKMEIALSALEKLKPRVNAFLVIPNERIFQIIDKKTPLKAALSAINKMLSESLEGLIEMIYEPGLINIDFADLRTIFEGQGKLSYLNTVLVQKKKDTSQEAVEKVLNNPLYPYSIRGAKGVLLNIAGEKDLELAEVSRISKTISGLVNKEAKIIFGISRTRHRGGYPKYPDVIKTTLLATGCQVKIFPGKSRKKRPKKKQLIEKPPLIEKKPQPKPKAIKKRKKSKPPHQNIGGGGKPNQKSIPKKAKKTYIKIKVQKDLKEDSQPEAEEKTVVASNPSTEQERLRKNALQIKREMEEAEKEIEAQEKSWETPAFLRRQKLS